MMDFTTAHVSQSSRWMMETDTTQRHTHLKMLHNQMQDVYQLRHCVALLHDYLARPVGQHLVPIFHPGWNCWRQNSHRLSDDGSRFHGMSLEKTVEYLKGKVLV